MQGNGINFKSVPLSAFHDHVNIDMARTSLKGSNGFDKEFEELAHLMSSSHIQEYIPIDKEMKLKNRYTNILPVLDTRVCLQEQVNHPSSTYINANYLRSNLQGSNTVYISTQAPLKHTLDDFWRMIWEQHSLIVLMLTRIIEMDRVKCYEYFPDTQGNEIRSEHFRVVCQSHQASENVIVRKLMIFHGSLEREIHHIHYIGWPDFGVPDSYESYLKVFQIFKQIQSRIASPQPIVVHCSAGVGRSGTFIAIDILLDHIGYSISMPDTEISIQKLVYELRLQRSGMIQTNVCALFMYILAHSFIKLQYAFVYRFIDFCLENNVIGSLHLAK